MSEVGRTEKDEKIAELEVWVFRELSPRLGAQKTREETRPGSRGPVRASPCCALAGPGVGGVRPALPGSDWGCTGLWGGHVHLTYTQVGHDVPASSFFSSRVVSCIVLVFVLYVIRSKSIQLPGQSVSYFTDPPRAHPSAVSPSGSAAPGPGQTQVPSTRSRYAPGGFGTTQLSQVRSFSPGFSPSVASVQGGPCRFLPCDPF